jgi:asparagine synthase (glutamine-hydrolysing)
MARNLLRGMNNTIFHRGPDDGGEWVDPSATVGLANRRLAIVDLSAAGQQPMHHPDGRFTLVFNGEIYNHAELRRELEVRSGRIAWRGGSDTEVLLAGFATLGVEETLKRCVGMFAIAVWDGQARTLTLARDRIGEKPLYYGVMPDGTLLFGSELKTLRAHPSFDGRIDPEALALYLRYGYVPAPRSIFAHVRKLTPGCLVTLSPETLRTVSTAGLTALEKPYWSMRDVAEAGMSRPFAGDDRAAVSRLEQLLRQAISLQMIADVPLGAFLSGGVDSSTIVALMQNLSREQGGRPVKTFTIGFTEPGYNEAVYAKEVAAHLGTEHTELYVDAARAREVIPMLPHLYDEPFADASQVPTYLVAQLARQRVTVSLSGDAGDELFAGYERYDQGQALWRRGQTLPAGLRRAGAAALTTLSPRTWESIIRNAQPFLPRRFRKPVFGDYVHKAANMLGTDSLDEMYDRLIAQWNPAPLVTPSRLSARRDAPTGMDVVSRMQYADMHGYLPDDILVKVDRAAMGVSLETRVPMLDHRVVEFAFSLPANMKVRDGQTKWLLRQVLYQHVPSSMIERPKQGFAMPVGEWMRGPLRDWTESLLDAHKLREQGYLDPVPIHAKWNEHLSGARDWKNYLWDVLMFQAWLEDAQHPVEIPLEAEPERVTA